MSARALPVGRPLAPACRVVTVVLLSHIFIIRRFRGARGSLPTDSDRRVREELLRLRERGRTRPSPRPSPPSPASSGESSSSFTSRYAVGARSAASTPRNASLRRQSSLQSVCSIGSEPCRAQVKLAKRGNLRIWRFRRVWRDFASCRSRRVCLDPRIPPFQDRRGPMVQQVSRNGHTASRHPNRMKTARSPRESIRFHHCEGCRVNPFSRREKEDRRKRTV